MLMNQEQFDALVKRLEGFARKQPASYKFRVGLLAALGYAYIFLVLAGLLAIFGLVLLALIYSRHVSSALIKVGIVVLVPVFIVLKSLWVRFPPPTGLELTPQEVPDLFALINELTSALQAPRFHRILLTEEFNAGVRQVPRLGIFGWQQNYLLIGLPLMQALSPEQFRAVLAHEFGHLSGNHNRFSAWIYRIQETYYQMLERLRHSGHDGSSVLFDRFFNWYAPFFSAYSFVLRRTNEYEADRCAAELAGAQNIAEALINIKVKDIFLQSSFWPSIYKQVERQVEPPMATFTSMFSALGTGVNSEDASTWIDQVLAEKTSNVDTHPCLSDRLSALGYLPLAGQQILLPAPVQLSAAQKFLGKALSHLTAHFDRTWQEEMATPWRQRYAYAQEAQKTLQTLDEKARNGSLTAEEAWNRACWTAEFKGHEVAIALFQEILSTEPNHPAANYALGQILLKQNDAHGIIYIEKAIAGEPDNIIPGCELIYYFLKQQGEIEKAKVYQQRIEKHYDLISRARQERSFVSEKDEFQTHNVPASTVQHLCQHLSNYPQVQEAYLVRKVVQYFPEKPFYILGVTLHRNWWKVYTSEQDNDFFRNLTSEMEFPGSLYVLVLNNVTNEQVGSNKKLGKIFSKIEEASIYRS
ncbi:M48 family metalloprotease [Trichocoleus sp. FACHB-90]|nr:M48 family metalloprotease [Trichocoleus sp. FACHB-90]